MFVSKEIKQRVTARVEECYSKAESRLNCVFTRPTWDYETRGKTAGWANPNENSITFNGQLLVENADDFILTTVSHEIAHLITHQVHGIIWTRGGKVVRHGREWKNVMQILGVDHSRCHSYDVSRSTVRKSVKHELVCNNCQAKLLLGPKAIKSWELGRQYKSRECRCRGWANISYRYIGIEGIVKPQLKVADKPAPTLTSVRTYKTKLEHCKAIYASNRLTRPEMIERFVREVGCTSAGASTYYSSCKKSYYG